MKDTRFSKILTEGSRASQDRDPAATEDRQRGGSNGDSTKRDPQGSGTAHASLYEDTLSRKADSQWRSVALVVGALVVAGALIVFFSGGSSATKPLINLGDDAPSDTASSEPAPAQNPLSEAPSGVPSESLATGEAMTPATPAAQASPPVKTTQAEPKSVEPPPPPAADPPAKSASPEPPVETREIAKADLPAAVPAPKEAPADSPPPAKPRPVPRRLEIPPPGSSAGPQNSAASAAALDPAPGAPIQDSGEDADAPAQPVRGTEGYKQLLSGSEVAAKLVAGGFPTISYVSWRVVQQTDSETWIDVIGRWNSSGDEVHFIWSVRRESGEVRALSEAARNLERSSSPTL